MPPLNRGIRPGATAVVTVTVVRGARTAVAVAAADWACRAMPASGRGPDPTAAAVAAATAVAVKKTSLESGDDSEEESEILEESPCGRWLKRREVVRIFYIFCLNGLYVPIMF